MQAFKEWVYSHKFSMRTTFLLSSAMNWLSALFAEDTKVSPAKNLPEAAERLKALTYSPDEIELWGKKIKHGWMRTASWVQRMLNSGHVPQTDCDEFALYACALLAGVFGVFRPRLLTVRWVLPNGEIKGHNTCVFSYEDARASYTFGTLCNWGLKMGRHTARECAEYFAKASGGRLLVYAVSTPELKILKHVRIA